MTTMRFLAIDPGDVWVGLAYLQIEGRHWHAETRVLCRQQEKSFSETVQSIFATGSMLAKARAEPKSESVVICESYQQRPVGHQAFSGGQTLQLIGALRYVTEHLIRPNRWMTVMPGNPDKELPQLPINEYLNIWSPYWPDNRSTGWRHARAAWRVLARGWLTAYPELLSALRDTRTLDTVQIAKQGTIPKTNRNGALYAPHADWFMHAHRGD